MHHPHLRHLRPAILLLALAACGVEGGEPRDAGSGGGPGGPGGTGNPLDIVLEFTVANEHSTARTETICASVPFPENGYPNTSNLVVSGHQTAWLPLQQWAGGSVKVAQAQFTDTLEPGETRTYRIARDEPALAGAFTRNAWVAQAGTQLQVGAEVLDTFSVPYRGFAAGPGTVVQSSPLVQTTRWRTYHQPVGQAGIGRDYLTSTFYATEYRDMPFVVVDWVLGNDYLGADTVPPGNTDPNLRALGTADVRAASFLCRGATQVLPYRPETEAIAAATATGDGFTAFRVLQDTFLADAQTRRYRFLLRFVPPGANADDVQRWQETATAMLARPLYALATQSTWQQTSAAGLLGGPIPGPANSRQLAEAEYQGWANAGHFGPWGSRGDPLVTATTGTPRNHPLSPELAHAIQGGYPRLLQKLEQMAWAQAMRPYHLWQLQVGAEQNILLWDGTPMLLVPGESLGRRSLRDSDPYPQYRAASAGQPRAHGWEHFDHEHWSCDLLFDYWTVSGDAWAREELRQLGQSLKGLMRLTVYYTANIQAARAEGWCMQGFAQCYQATRDEALKAYAMRRVDEIIDVQRQKNHPSRALAFQGNYPGTGYPMDHQFFMPWQHGAVLYGFLGAYRCFAEPKLLQIAEAVVDTVQYAWVTNVQSPQFGQVVNGLRYYVPVSHNGVPVPANYWDGLAGGIRFGDAPLGGAHTFLTASLHHLAAMTGDASVRTRALLYGGLLLGTLPDGGRWNKWNYCLPPQYTP
ncbi:MAG: hypothetical protein KF830_13655 [Planctomycetes bacterium]|nr:hypothetical protein [Planctomycetota bacterium]